MHLHKIFHLALMPCEMHSYSCITDSTVTQSYDIITYKGI